MRCVAVFALLLSGVCAYGTQNYAGKTILPKNLGGQEISLAIAENGNIMDFVLTFGGKTAADAPVVTSCKSEEFVLLEGNKIGFCSIKTNITDGCTHVAEPSRVSDSCLYIFTGKGIQLIYDPVADSFEFTFPKFIPAGHGGVELVKMDLTKIDAPMLDQQHVAPKTSLRPVISFAGSSPAKVTDCTSAGAHAKLVGEVTITPNPPTRGATVTINGKGEVDEEVTGGTYEMSATYSGLKIVDHKHSICGDDSIGLPMGMGNIELTGLTCPQAAGSIELTQKFTVPRLAPSGTMKSHFVAKDQNGDELICLDMEFSF